MKGYKYTIESIGGIVTSFDAEDRFPIDKLSEWKILTIYEDGSKEGSKIHIFTANIIRITEEETEI